MLINTEIINIRISKEKKHRLMPILIKEKPCKGTGKCLGLGCGQMQKIRKYGLGSKKIYLFNKLLLSLRCKSAVSQ